LAVTVPAFAVKVPLVAPAAIVTDAGTVSAALFEDNATEEPPVGAAFDSVTVHDEVAPGAIEAGAHCSAETVTVTATGGGATPMPALMSAWISAAESGRL